jgi:hypothetical protein
MTSATLIAGNKERTGVAMTVTVTMTAYGKGTTAAVETETIIEQKTTAARKK